MKREQIIQTIKTLSSGQGFYGRIFKQLSIMEENSPEQYEEVMEELEAQDFEDLIDLIMYMEG